jgi:hypothetical protein
MSACRTPTTLDPVQNDDGHLRLPGTTLTICFSGCCRGLLVTNVSGLTNRAARYGRGQRISTAAVESRVNRVIGHVWRSSNPCAQSRPGAHRLIQVRVAVREGGLQAAFRCCYPRFPMPVGREATPT